MGFAMAGGGWVVVEVVWVLWGRVGLPNTAEFNMAVLWWEHGVCVVCTKQRCFANKIVVDSMRVSSPRLVAKQTCRNSALSFGFWEDPLSMMIGRAGGWMEWSGAV